MAVGRVQGTVVVVHREGGPSVPCARDVHQGHKEFAVAHADSLFPFSKQPKRDHALPYHTFVMRSRRELLTNVTSLLVVDAAHKINVRLER